MHLDPRASRGSPRAPGGHSSVPAPRHRDPSSWSAERLSIDYAPGPLRIAVTANKGGTGKSTISAALAWALDRAGRRVLLIDTDIAQGHALNRIFPAGAPEPLWGSHGRSMAVAYPWIPFPKGGYFDTVVSDGRPSPDLEAEKGPVDIAVYVIGDQQDIGPGLAAANLLASTGQAMRVVVLLNDRPDCYQLKTAFHRIFSNPPRLDGRVHIHQQALPHSEDFRAGRTIADWQHPGHWSALRVMEELAGAIVKVPR